MSWVCSHSSTHHISEESVVLRVLIISILLDISLCVLHGLINDGEHSFWSLLWLVNLKEGMLMTSSFFAHGAEVKVLADAALVSHTGDWGKAAAVTLYTCMDDRLLLLLGTVGRGVDLVLVSVFSKLSAVHKVLEDALALLVKLLLDEFLEALSWKTIHALVLLACLLLLSTLGLGS